MSAQSTASRSFLTRRWVLLIVGVGVVVGALTVAILASQNNRGNRYDERAVFAVRQGPLLISVTESGTIEAREQVEIRSGVEGRTTILYMVEEGTDVEEGDLLIELDASQLLDNRVDQEIRVQNAEADQIRAYENLAVTENQAEADVAQAELDLRFAKTNLRKYHDGEYPQEVEQRESDITLAEEELQRAEDKLEWSEKLYNEGFIAFTDFQADELSFKRREIELNLAINRLRLLEDYTREQELDQLESAVEQAEFALDRVKRRARSDVVQAEADLRAKEADLERQVDRLKRINEQIENATIYAPTSGMVVYATTGRGGGWRGNQEPLEEGSEVREREELIYLPTTSAMNAITQVHESSLDKIQRGQRARVTIDALPGRSFRGRVSRIAPLPDAQSVWMNPDLKVYRTVVTIEEDGTGLRTGMSCRVEIIVDHYEDVTYVPVQSVVRVGDQPTVFVVGPDGVEDRPVELGLDNNRMVHIVSGLTAGERVLLNPPLDRTGVTAFDQSPLTELEQLGEGEAAEPEGDGADPSEHGEGGERGEAGERGGPGGGGFDWQNATPEQREQMRQRFENMSDEEREQMRQRFGGQRGGGEGRRGGGPGGPGGGPGGRGGSGGAGGGPQRGGPAGGQ